MHDAQSLLLPAHNDDPIMPRLGEHLGGARLLDVVGAGPNGRVYRARLEGSLRFVAVKVLYRGSSIAASRFAAYVDDARTVSALAHPNVATLLGASEPGAQLAYTMHEHVRGESLRALVDRLGPQPLSRVLRVAEQIANAVSAAHRAGVVHHGLKLENVMLTQSGGELDVVKVLDFGCARLRQCVFTAHEARADIHALGAMLFELSTGSPLRRCASARAPVPSVLERLLLACLEPAGSSLSSMCRVVETLRALRSTSANVSPVFGARLQRRARTRLRALASAD